MSVLIKGMKMPKMCTECEIRDVEEDYWGEIVSLTCPIIRKNVEDYGWRGKCKRHEDCPMVEVPEPHGRLIEAPEIEWEAVGGGEKEISLGALIALAHKVDNASTVIEAEGEDNERID